ncbi:CHAT domain-containing protein, partial [Mycena vulgaris]
ANHTAPSLFAFFRNALDFAPAENDSQATLSHASSLITEFNQSMDSATLDKIISLYQDATSSLAAADSNNWKLLWELSDALLLRFGIAGHNKDLDEAVSLLKDAESKLSWGHSLRWGIINDLAMALWRRFNLGADAKDLDSAFELHEEALSLCPLLHPNRGTSLHNLACVLGTRFENQGNVQNIDDAVELLRAALALYAVPHANRGCCLTNLADAIRIRFQQQGNVQDIDEAVELNREALSLSPSPHPLRGTCLNNLALSLCIRLTQSARNGLDIDEVIQLHQEALTLRHPPHPERGSSLNNLADAFRNRFVQRGNAEDINRAVQLYREALKLFPSPHPRHGSSLGNLAFTVLMRFEHQGDVKDIDEAVQLNRTALALHQLIHPEHGSSLNNLANAIIAQFNEQGNMEDIRQLAHQPLEPISGLFVFAWPHPRHGSSLYNLANAVSTRFEQRGNTQDIDEAVHLFQKALLLRPWPHSERGSCLNSLANASLARFNFQQHGNIQDVNEVIQLHREALALRPSSHSERGYSLSDLANALRIRFQQLENRPDIEEAVQLHREALALRPSSYQQRSSSLNNLANVLAARFKQFGDVQDIKESLQLHREALLLHPSPHPQRGTDLRNLGLSLVAAHTHMNNPDWLDEAISFLDEASTSEFFSPLSRFIAAHSWARTAEKFHHSSALTAYNEAINLLPQLAALHLDVRSRQQILTTTHISHDFASAAAICAIGLDHYGVAVEFLEAGRSVFWSQALHLRNPLHNLKTVPPQLAKEISALSRELEHASFRDISRKIITDMQERIISIEAEGVRYHHLTKDWEAAVKSINQDFMRPKGIMKLQQAAIHGPVVILCAGSSCHALIVNTSDVQGKFLMCHSRSRLENSEDLSLEARLFGRLEVLDNTSPNTVFESLLAALWITVVKPVFNEIDLKSVNPPRLWWCPTGPFTFLPVHAAGIYGKDSTDCASDYVVSSYTPTLTALLNPPSRAPTTFEMTAVIQPDSKHSPLPATRAELKKIEEKVPKQWLNILGDTTEATIKTVLAHLQKSSIVHFAGHGAQNGLDSGLVLSDGLLKVSDIIRKPEIEISEGVGRSKSLAFLSACETAKGDFNIPDETIHLAASLLFAGFSGVVATMWTMRDSDGPKIANTFYEHLFRNCDPTVDPPTLPDLTEAAEALHLAVSTLRKDSTIDFERWVPFVHYG